MKYLFLLFILIVSTTFILPNNNRNYSKEVSKIKTIVSANTYNQKYTILVDYSIPSGKKRLFIYNLHTDRINKKFLVAQGDGCLPKNGNPTFSNEIGSNCSSLGIAVLGGRDYSKWGINVKYWLDGKSNTNSNFRKRVVVLHSWWGIPDDEVYPFNIPKSQGCFTVSNSTMRYLDNFIRKQENKKIIIYSFK